MRYVDVNGAKVSMIGRSRWTIDGANLGVIISKNFNLSFYIIYLVTILIIYMTVGFKGTIFVYYLFALAPSMIAYAIYNTILRQKGRKWRPSLIEVAEIEVSETLRDNFYPGRSVRATYSWSARFMCKNSQGQTLYPDDRQRNFLTESQALYALSRVIEDGKLRVRVNPKDALRCFVDW
jgi:hypothetical protein